MTSIEAREVVLFLAEDPEYHTPNRLALLVHKFSLDPKEVLSWVVEAGFYKPEGVVKIGTKDFRLSRKEILEAVQVLQIDDTQYKKLLGFKG